MRATCRARASPIRGAGRRVGDRGVSAATADGLGIAEGAVRVTAVHGGASTVLPVRIEPGLADGCVRLPTAHPATAMLGAQFTTLRIEKAPPQAAPAGAAAATVVLTA